MSMYRRFKIIALVGAVIIRRSVWRGMNAIMSSDFKNTMSSPEGGTGGHIAESSYSLVCTGKTGRAEAVEVIFNLAIRSKIIGFITPDVFWLFRWRVSQGPGSHLLWGILERRQAREAQL